MAFEKDFNIFIGGKTGILKGVHITQNNIIIKNLQNVKSLTAGNEITVLSWGDTTETDILVCTRDQSVKVYDTEFKSFSSCLKTKLGEGPIVGVTRYNDVITTCSASGHIKVWKHNKENEVQINTNGPVEKMEASGLNTGILGIGGRGNDLQLWDLTKKEKIFHAKNVKKNELDVEVPVWISDLKIIPETDYKVVTASRYGQVRLYDTKLQRRPVIEFSMPDQSLQCVALAHREHQVVVGSGTGYILLLDLRMGNTSTSNRVLSTFKGATGSVRQIVCHKTKPYLASVGLDSYFRMHNLDNKKIIHQQFMQVKLNAVLMRSSFQIEPEQEDVMISAMNSEEQVQNQASDEMNSMFDSLETVGGKRPRLSLS